MAQTTNVVPKLYRCVIDDVVTNIREAFLDEGVDEQVLQELKQIWENKVLHSKAIDHVSLEHDHVLNTQYTLEKQQTQQPVQVQFQPSSHSATLQAQLQQPALVQPVYAAYDLSMPAAAATMALPPNLLQRQLTAVNSAVVTSHQQGHTTTYYQGVPQTLGTQTFVGVSQIGQPSQTSSAFIQLDGARDTSDEEESDNYGDDDNDQDNEDDQNDDENDYQGEEEEPLNSNDDVSDDDDASELFDTDNVVVCQYDKISRSRNKWKFHLKDGIMNLQGKDYVFQKAIGDAEW